MSYRAYAKYADIITLENLRSLFPDQIAALEDTLREHAMEFCDLVETLRDGHLPQDVNKAVANLYLEFFRRFGAFLEPLDPFGEDMQTTDVIDPNSFMVYGHLVYRESAEPLKNIIESVSWVEYG